MFLRRQQKHFWSGRKLILGRLRKATALKKCCFFFHAKRKISKSGFKEIIQIFLFSFRFSSFTYAFFSQIWRRFIFLDVVQPDWKCQQISKRDSWFFLKLFISRDKSPFLKRWKQVWLIKSNADLFSFIFWILCANRTLAKWLECSPMAREIWVQSQVESYQRLKKWYLMPPCLTLSIIR